MLIVAMAITLALLFAADLPADSLRTIEQLIAEGQYGKAIESADHAPPSPQRHLLVSKAYDSLGDPKRAVEEAEAALALNPRFEPAHLQLGQIFLGHNTPQAAFEIFSEALDLFPQSFPLRLGRGLALKELQRYEDAEKDLLTCLDQKPDFPLAFDALATVYLRSNRYDDMQRLADSYRQRHADDYRGPYYAAAAREARKEEDAEALTLARESIRLNPAFAAACALTGKLLLRAGQPSDAIGPLETALRLRPDYSPAALHLAQAYRAAGRSADAARAFEQFRIAKEREQDGPPTLRFGRGKR